MKVLSFLSECHDDIEQTCDHFRHFVAPLHHFQMLSLFTYIFVAWGAIWCAFLINLSTGCLK